MASNAPIELEPVGGAHALLDEVKSALAGDVDVAHLHRSLASSRDVFLNLLSFKKNNAASRALVESGNLHTTLGHITLDKVPDIQEITKLSDELKLDELVCLAFVLHAQQQSEFVSAASAAFVLYRERECAVQALLALLHAQVGGGDLPSDVYSTIGNFNAVLLQTEEGGSTVLVRRLAELIQAGSVLPPPDSPLATVVDNYGRPLDRADIIQKECTALCQCLFYACCIKQRMTPSDVERLLDLLHHMALHARTPGPHQLTAQHQANLVLLSVVLTMLPLEDVSGDAQTQDDRALRELGQHAGVGAKIAAHSASEDPYSVAVRFAWGMLPLLCEADQRSVDRGETDVKASLTSGALGFLGTGVMGSIGMAQEDEDVRVTAASVLHQMLVLFMEVSSDGMQQLRRQTLDGAQKELEVDTQMAEAPKMGLGGDSLMVVDTRSNGFATGPAPIVLSPDTLSTLLFSLAAVFTARPALYLDEDRRSPFVSQVMMELGEDQYLRNVPSIFLSYLAVLTALAHTEIGARMVFTQLRGHNAPPLVGWRRMFDILQAIVRRYNPPQGQENGPSATQSRTSDSILPTNDTNALCAFAHLFERIMLEGNPDEVASWVRLLDDEAGIAPSWEILFQVMCCPVPQSLKAALDSAIASIARRPDLAAALWDRLLAAVVVQPYASPGAMDAAGAAVPRYDLVFQLNEIESRAEDYQEVLSFVELLNSLWRAAGTSLADDGRSVAHFTRFVRDELLATVFQRAFKDESQRWALVAACLEHCRLSLQALTASPATLAAELATAGAARAPGLDVLLDLLSEKNAARAALTTLSIGVEGLAAERNNTIYGAAKEAAALAALRILHAAFQHDAEFVAAARRSLQYGAYETFEAVLRHDRSRIPVLFQFVSYPFNTKLQEEALRLATDIAGRTPNLVQVLVTVPGLAGDIPIAQRLRDSFAACMDDAVSIAPPRRDHALSESPESEEQEDHRAALVIELLLSSLETPTPNLTQLLCGYWVDGGALPLVFQDYHAMHTPLRVILDYLSTSRNATLRPRVFEQCLELVYDLADGLDTGAAMLDLLRSYHGVLVSLLEDVACAPLPPTGLERAASLHQRAWLLQLFALELRRADPAVGAELNSLQQLLSALFGQSERNSGSGVPTRGKFIDVLAVAVSDIPPEPQLGSGASNEVRRMIQALEIETLLGSPAAPGEGGIHGVGPRGDPLLDVAALKDELLNRLSEWVARHGAPGEAMKEAGRAALSYAAQFNSYAEEMGGRLAFLEGWQAVVSVAFTDRFDILADLVGGNGTSATDLVMTAAEHALQGAALVLQGPAAGLAPALCGAAESLFARLQDAALAAATIDPLCGLPLPSRCHGLLTGLLAVAWDGRSQESVRLMMYTSIIGYLAMCRGPALLHAPPAVVGALLEGVRSSGGGSAEQLDAVQLQLEEGNVSILHANTRILQLLSRDAVSPNPTAATSALTALASLVAADPSTVLADEIHRIALPARLFQDLQDQSQEALVQPPPVGQAVTLVAEAKLALLLRLALAGPPTHRAASAQKLFSLQALPRLAASRALDLQPEEPGFGATGPGGTSLRQRLHQLLTPALRLVLALSTALPHSAAVREQTAAFVVAHERAIARILRDAASSGVRGWEPSDAELDEATLAMQILCELAPLKGLVPPQVAPALQEAAYRAASRFLASNARSQSPPVVRIAAAKDSGAPSAADQRTYAKILGLRCALSSYLCILSSHPEAPTLLPCVPAATGDLSGVSPTLFLIKDALLQAAVHDLPDALGEQAALIGALRGGPDGSALVQRGQEANSAEQRAALVKSAGMRQGEISRLGYLIEHLLAILFQHLRLGGGKRRMVGGALAALRPSNIQTPTRDPIAQLGSAKDLDQLRRLTEPAIAALERMLGERSLPGDGASFELLIRRTKECLATL